MKRTITRPRSRAQVVMEAVFKHCVLPAVMGVILGGLIVAVMKFPFATAMVILMAVALMKLRKDQRRKRLENWHHAAIPHPSRDGYALPYSQSIYSRYGSRSF